MPNIRFEFSASPRNRPLSDRVKQFILDGDRVGTLRHEENRPVDHRRFRVNAPPDRYRIFARMGGFQDFTGQVQVTKETASPILIELQHRCLQLPEYEELSPTQQGLLASSGGEAEGRDLWESLSDNQAAAFFQVSYALSRRQLSNGRTLDSYIESIYRFGGAKIESDLPDMQGRIRRAKGWRQHVAIRPQDQDNIEADIQAGEVFGPKDKTTHGTHKKFGLTKSHREKGNDPKLQIVLSESNTFADLDLDVDWNHRSAPHRVYGDFVKKFPETAGIYRF